MWSLNILLSERAVTQGLARQILPALDSHSVLASGLLRCAPARDKPMQRLNRQMCLFCVFTRIRFSYLFTTWKTVPWFALIVETDEILDSFSYQLLLAYAYTGTKWFSYLLLFDYRDTSSCVGELCVWSHGLCHGSRGAPQV